MSKKPRCRRVCFGRRCEKKLGHLGMHRADYSAAMVVEWREKKREKK